MNKSLVALHLHHQLSVLEVIAILIDVHSCIPLFSFCSSVNIVSCLLVICISSLVRCLLGSFVYFKIRLFLFLFFFCILDTRILYNFGYKSLSDMRFANIFF